MRHRTTGIAVALVAMATSAACQGIERQVGAIGDGSVQFHFASRDGICGNGRTFFRIDDDGWYQTTGSGSFGSDGRTDACARGPVRVVVTRAGRETVRIETYAGPLATPAEDGRDLGAVGAKDAVTYLLGVAASAEGRAAREALTPALMADSAVVTPPLLSIARDQGRPRDVRRSALNWLARRRNEPGGVGAAEVARALNAIVRNRDEGEPMRQSALSTVANLNRGEGIPTLIGFVSDADTWVARQAMASLSRSGDPRARQFTRDAVKRTDLADELRSEVIRGLGGEYATGADYKLLRDMYGTLNNDRDREAVISTLANAGGATNTQWLLDLARSETEPIARRRRAINALAKSDDPRVREALKGLLERK